MDSSSNFVGVAFSDMSLNATLHPSGAEQVFPNTPIGIAALVTYLETIHPRVIALESAGGDVWPVVTALAEAFLPVIVVNPRQVREFALATGILAQTAAREARVLARFAETVRVGV